MGYLETAREVLASLRGSDDLSMSRPLRKNEGNDATPSATAARVDWPTLAAQRWGPAVGDPTPGIIIDQPDPDRRRLIFDGIEPPPRGPRPEAESPIEPDPDVELTSTILAAGFIPVDPESHGAPAWLADESLSVTPADVRASNEFHRDMNPGDSHHVDA